PRDSQPIEYVRAGAPPALLLAATKDDLVNPQRNSVGMATRLRAAGVPVTLKLYERVSHVTLLAAITKPLDWLAPVRAEVLAFLGLPAGS
ncbi:MAG: alpha/beta hydrolase, partial [Ramlibacter sp.]|nr:alpha/beta hydrolase [Ramlibacter sp.]